MKYLSEVENNIKIYSGYNSEKSFNCQPKFTSYDDKSCYTWDVPLIPIEWSCQNCSSVYQGCEQDNGGKCSKCDERFYKAISGRCE